MTAIQVILYLLIFMLGFFCGWHRRDGIASRSEMDRKQKEAESRRVRKLVASQTNLGRMAYNLIQGAFQGTFAEVLFFEGVDRPFTISTYDRDRDYIFQLEVDAFHQRVRVRSEKVCYQYPLSEANVLEASNIAIGLVDRNSI
jgi:hypothetical protein